MPFTGVMSPLPLPQTSDDQFRAAVNSTAVGMAILGFDGVWQEVNPALAALLGHGAGASPESFRGSGKLFDVVQPAAVADLSAEVDALISGEVESIDRLVACARGASQFDARINLALLRDSANVATGLVLQMQVDDGAHAVSERESLRREMQAQIDAVAHDLRAPLRSIDNFAGLLTRKLGDALDDGSRDQLGRIRGAATRMARLLDGLSELSRAATAPIRRVAVDLSLLADWAAAEQQDAHPDREFRISVQPGLVTHGDERLLKAMLVQVLDNARRFSHACAPVTVDVSGSEADGSVRVSIRDKGRGFDMRYRHKLFEPFQRLHGADEGAGDGLGLAVARRIAERHGGHIDAESSEDTGTVFHIQLPAAVVAGVSSGDLY